MTFKNGAFTLIELLVVIAIIGILASIGITTYNGALQRTRAATILSHFREIEDAMKRQLIAEGRQSWWTETDFGGEPVTMQDIYDNYGLDEYLANMPTPPGGTIYSYDHDNLNNTFECGITPYYVGVHIVAQQVGIDIANILDEQVDGGNGYDCGTIKSNGLNSVVYMIAPSGHDF